MFARLLVATALVLSLSSSAPASLINNGSFENGLDPGTFTTLGTGNTSITNWTIAGGSIDYIGTYWNASAGVRSIDLNGMSSGTLQQTFATTPGESYLLTFDLSGNPDGGNPIKTLTVTDGIFAQMFMFDTTANGGATIGINGNMRWQPQSFQFTASSASTTLSFIGDPNNGPFGPALDNVSVTAVPEPATLAVLGFGLLGMGAYTRRRKAAAV